MRLERGIGNCGKSWVAGVGSDKVKWKVGAITESCACGVQ